MIISCHSELLIYGKKLRKVSKILEDKARKNRLQIYRGFEGYYIGRRWDTISGTETIENFEKGVKKRLNKVFNLDTKCETFYQSELDY